jgi:hypothetical protein
MLRFRMRLDSTQQRLNNIGAPASLPAENRAQNPRFNAIAVHYIELASSPYTLLGQGSILYQTASTSQGGSPAILFDSLVMVNDNEVFFEIPLSQIPDKKQGKNKVTTNRTPCTLLSGRVRCDGCVTILPNTDCVHYTNTKKIDLYLYLVVVYFQPNKKGDSRGKKMSR